jgi:hypothetical protein
VAGFHLGASGPILSRRAVQLAASLACALVAILPGTAWTESSPLTPTDLDDRLAEFDGVWQRIDLPDEDRARLASIDRAVEDLSWILRKMAGPVLRNSTAPPPKLDFFWDGERLHQRVESNGGRDIRPVEFGAEPVERLDPRGEPFMSQWTWTAEGLQVRWEQRQARGSNLYRIDPRDQTLRVQHLIQVTALDDVSPIEYSSRFRRASLPSVSAARSDQPPTFMRQPIER